MFIYDLFILLYTLSVRLAAPFNAKARRWVAGRRGWEKKLADGLAAAHAAGRPVVWVHCSSLGEFEQGRPVIEALKERRPETAVLLTFFSPSGYEIRKDYPAAEAVTYLPADSRRNARRFLDIARPELVIFVKYEIWYHHLREVQRRKIPLLLISALFRKEQVFFHPTGVAFRQLLAGFDRLFVQNGASHRLLRDKGFTNSRIAGDTRIDRVLQIARQAREFPVVAEFAAGVPVLVAGSTWPPDEAILAELLNHHLPAGWKVIIAPHRISEEAVRGIAERLTLRSSRYSQAEKAGGTGDARVLIIDNIGMLAGLYRYGRLAYIGGGFGVAIHNTLEPIAFGLPVLFGPRYRRFEEAVQLVERGGAWPVTTAGELVQRFRELEDPGIWRQASQQAKEYLEENRGATGVIIRYIEELEEHNGIME